ncbi:MAG: hypothetical protein LUQ38_09290 [Methanotrichaceae archaeon]|nr:hypothetical protein [Methanotrichaceae archaeon]
MQKQFAEIPILTWVELPIRKMDDGTMGEKCWNNGRFGILEYWENLSEP